MSASSPDPQPELATDAVDRLLLMESGAARAASTAIVVVDDGTGALSHAIRTEQPAAVIRTYNDSASAEQRVARVASGPRQDCLDASLLAGADVVLVRMPKSLAALEEVAAAVAAYAAPTVQLWAGGLDRHLSRGMNAMLADHFDAVRGTLGRQKARALVAARPRTRTPAEPRRRFHPDLGVTLVAYGGTFAGDRVDLGTRALAECLDQLPPAERILDLGCGNGVLAVLAARQQPQAVIAAVDDSRAALRSTAASAQANGVSDRISCYHSHRLDHLGDSSIDLVLCNPPFHRGTAKDSGPAYAMFADAARVLRPGGELWVVFNTHLPYLNHLRRVVGSTRIARQTPKFIVARAKRR